PPALPSDRRPQRVPNPRRRVPEPPREALLHRHNLASLYPPAQLRLRDPADRWARTLTHQEAPKDADSTFFLTCSKWPDKPSGFNPRPRYAPNRFLYNSCSPTNDLA